MPPRVFIIDPGYGSLTGHHPTANVALAAQLGMPVTIVATERLRRDVTIANARIERRFRIALYAASRRLRFAEGRGGKRRMQIADRLSVLFRPGLVRDPYGRDLGEFLDDHAIGGGDHLVIHTHARLLTWRLAELVAASPTEAMPTIHVRFVGVPGDDVPIANEPMATLLREGKLHLYAELKSVAAEVSRRFGGHPVDLLRLGLGPTELPNRAKPSEPFHVLYFGELRDEKGWRRLPAIAQLLKRDGGDIRMTMHVGNAHALRKRRNVGGLPAIRDAGIDLVGTTLSDRDMSLLLASADVVILPYDPRAYRLRASAVAFDSMTHGVPIVVAADSAHVEFVEDGNGLDARSDEDFVAAILQIKEQYPAFRRRAEVVAAASRSWVGESGLPARIRAG